MWNYYAWDIPIETMLGFELNVTHTTIAVYGKYCSLCLKINIKNELQWYPKFPQRAGSANLRFSICFPELHGNEIRWPREEGP